MKPYPQCTVCDEEDWVPIPDSLAIACKNCGSVQVSNSDGWESGVSIQQWLADVYGIDDLDPPEELAKKNRG